MKKCENCLFWRDKGWDAKGNGRGKCDNFTVHDQVVISMPIWPTDDSKNDYLRFSNDFCCKHHEKIKV
jgi:hypothetical protein